MQAVLSAIYTFLQDLREKLIAGFVIVRTYRLLSLAAPRRSIPVHLVWVALPLTRTDAPDTTGASVAVTVPVKRTPSSSVDTSTLATV